jgi:hypothetical protein
MDGVEIPEQYEELLVQYSDELEIPLEAVVELAIQNLLERIKEDER